MIRQFITRVPIPIPAPYIHTGKSTRQRQIFLFFFFLFFFYFLFHFHHYHLRGTPCFFYRGFSFFFALFCPVAKPRTYHMLDWPSAGQCPRVRECDDTITMANRKYCAGLGTTIFAITVFTAPASETRETGISQVHEELFVLFPCCYVGRHEICEVYGSRSLHQVSS